MNVLMCDIRLLSARDSARSSRPNTLSSSETCITDKYISGGKRIAPKFCGVYKVTASPFLLKKERRERERQIQTVK